ncbi:MAG: hypothetical protein IR526_02430 [Bordetella sp.]|nr:MAG: hypothetical protein IR526_02430 [Bordetella sp.]
MQASKLPAISGLYWTSKGWIFFTQHPINMLSWSLSLSLIILLLLSIPILGLLLNIILMPAFMLISFSLGKRMSEGKSIPSNIWLHSFTRTSDTIKNILLLGTIYGFVCIIVLILSFVPFLNEFTNTAEQIYSNTYDFSSILIKLYKPIGILIILSIVINAFFWYAPVLIAWHNLNFLQALFFSAIACWRNRFTFLIYGLIWITIFFFIDSVTKFMIKIGLPIQVANSIEIPLSLIANAVLWSSFYPSYSSVFSKNSD